MTIKYNSNVEKSFKLSMTETVTKPDDDDSNLGLIIGLSVGGLLLILVGVFLFIRYKRK